MKAFSDLYRRLDSATSTRAKLTAMVEAFAAAKADPTQWASAAWMVYFLSGGKPRQTVPTRILWRLAVEGSKLPEWLCAECYGNVGDLAETLTLLLPEGVAGEAVSLDVWMRERLLPLPSLDEEERYARLEVWVAALPQDQRLAFFKPSCTLNNNSLTQASQYLSKRRGRKRADMKRRQKPAQDRR